MEPEVLSRMNTLDQQSKDAHEVVKLAKINLQLANENFEAIETERRLFIEQYIPELSWRNQGRSDCITGAWRNEFQQ